MELKSIYTTIIIQIDNSFNRTFMELKLYYGYNDKVEMKF